MNNENLDKYFVDYSVKNLEDNLLKLAQLHYFGNHLEKKLEELFQYRISSNNYYKCKDFVSSIKIYSLLIKGENIENYYYEGDEESFVSDFEKFKKELITNLNHIFLPKYSFKKLILSFIEEDEIEYVKQSKFFKIDFRKIPQENIVLKDKTENLPDFNSYMHLYRLLLNHLERYKSLNLEWFIQMGMSPKQLEHCKEIYSSEVRNGILNEEEIQELLLNSISSLVKLVYF